MNNFDSVAEWLSDASDDEITDLQEWLDELEYGEEPIFLEPSDLDDLWLRIVRLAGGTLNSSLDRELRQLLGQIASLADLASAENTDTPDLIPTRCRLHLQAEGRSPSGVWAAALLADQLENAHRTHEVWAHLDPEAAALASSAELSAIADACVDLAATTRSVPTRRMLASTLALCAFRRGDVNGAITSTELFFDLERQSRRESAPVASTDELLTVAFAGVSAYAARHDSTGVAEVMRRVRLLAEPAGGMLQPVFINVWSSALLDLDPAFAQMLAQQMLRDVQEETGMHSDEAMSAAYALLVATLAVNEGDAVQTLVDEWVPVAFESEHGPGAQMWLESVKMEGPDASDDGR